MGGGGGVEPQVGVILTLGQVEEAPAVFVEELKFSLAVIDTMEVWPQGKAWEVAWESVLQPQDVLSLLQHCWIGEVLLPEKLAPRLILQSPLAHVCGCWAQILSHLKVPVAVHLPAQVLSLSVPVPSQLSETQAPETHLYLKAGPPASPQPAGVGAGVELLPW
mgnify:CR=1